MNRPEIDPLHPYYKYLKDVPSTLDTPVAGDGYDSNGLPQVIITSYVPRKRGLTDWLRTLKVGETRALPDEYTQNAVYPSARGIKIKVKTKEGNDKKIYVKRIE